MKAEKLGLIGIGQMGKFMAINLKKKATMFMLSMPMKRRCEK